MLDRTKTNPVLGKEIHEYLVKQGLETPTIPFTLSSFDKKSTIKAHFTEIMKALELDLTDDSLHDTPNRIAKMFVDELYWGLDYDNFPKITTVENKMSYDEMLIEKNIKVNSNCEHHFVTIWGKAHIAYIPKVKVIGLSKLNRITEYFSRRPQIQERLTEQIFYALEYILETSDIAVVIEADHFCVKSRGVEDINSSTISSKLGGAFKENSEVRSEFMGLIK